MSRTSHIRKSIILLASVAALVAPTAATAYPIIGDDPASAQSQAEGHAWYANYLKRQANRTKPVKVTTPKPTLQCPGHGKAACVLRIK
jgi:hypothetical protein